MAKFQILIDSTGDLPLELRQKYDIDYCPMTVSIDGEEVVASLDYDQGYTLKQFYDVMRNGKRIFTSQVPNDTFRAKFNEAAAKGEDVLYIACSSALSASVNAARVIAKEVNDLHPDRKIICFDSLISCYGQGEMAIKASEMREAGKTLEEVLAWLEENKFKFNQFATVESLSYLRQAGRVSAGAAFFGNMLGLKPIIISDGVGQNFAITKVKGTKKALMTLAANVVEAGEDLTGKTIFIGHADDMDDAKFVEAEVKRLAPGVKTYIGPIGPIVGASTGPGTIGVYVYGKEVTLNRK